MLQKYENNLEYNIWISNIFTIPMTKFLLTRYYRILCYFISLVLTIILQGIPVKFVN